MGLNELVAIRNKLRMTVKVKNSMFAQSTTCVYTKKKKVT